MLFSVCASLTPHTKEMITEKITKGELNTLKNEAETLNRKLSELTEEELAQVSGGNPQGSLHAVIDSEKCLCCSNCACSCPVEAIYTDGTHFFVNSGKCTGCGICVYGCPTAAFSLV